MTKRIISILLSLCLVLSIVPFNASAAETATVSDLASLQEAISSGTPAITLTDAITINSDTEIKSETPVTITTSVVDAFTVTGGTLTLGGGITINSSDSILWANGGNIVIDGATLNSANANTNAMVFAGNSSSTITIKEGSTLTADVAALTVASGAKAVMEGGNVSTTGASSPIRVRGTGSLVTINGGTVEAKVTDSSISAAFSYNGGKIVVNGGTLTVANDSYALIAAKTSGTSGGEVTVNGGTVEGVIAHEDGGSSATINGGTINGSVGARNGASTTINGGHVTGALVTDGNDSSKLTVSGGTFEQDPSQYLAQGVTTSGDASTGFLAGKSVSTLADLQSAISSGTPAITLTDAITINSDTEIKSETPVTITTSVVDAFTVTGGTLTLGGGITINSSDSILWANGGNIVIDGATLNSANANTNAMVFAGNSSSTITIKEGSTLTADVAALTVASGAKAVMDGGNVSTTGASSPIRVRGEGSLLTINGGTVEAKVTDSSISAAFSYNGGEIVVNGGTLTVANDSYALIAAKTTGTSGGEVTVNGGIVEGVIAHEDGGSSATINGGKITGSVGARNGASTTVNGGHVTGALVTDGNDSSKLTVSGGTFEQDPSQYLAEGYSALVKTDVGYEVVPSKITGAKFYWDGAHGLVDGLPYLVDASLYIDFAEAYTDRTGHKVVVADPNGKQVFTWDFTEPNAASAGALILSFANRSAANSISEAPTTGDYTITLSDGDGKVLDTRVVTIGAEAREPKIETLSYDAETDALTFTFNGKLLGDYVFHVTGTGYNSDTDAAGKALDWYSTGHTENVGWQDRGEMMFKLNPSGGLKYVENTDGTSTITLTGLNLTGGSGEYTVALNYMKGANAALERGAEIATAKFNIYTVAFVSNDQTLYTQSVGENGKAARPADPTLDGHTFGGWYSDEALTTEYDFGAPVTADLTLYAKWAKNEYTVSFEPGGGSGTMDARQVPHGEYTLPECGFTAPTGKEFKAWEVDGEEYAVGGKITVTADTTVVALWQDIECTVTFDAGESTSTDISETVPYGTQYTLPICEFDAPEGKQFAHWDVDGTEYEVGETITVTADITVTAIWEDETVPATMWTVTLTAGEGAGGDIQYTVEDGKTFTLPVKPEGFTAPEEGQQFAGWDVGGTVREVGETITVTADITVTAVWEDETVPATMWTVTLTAGEGAGSDLQYTVEDKATFTLPIKPNEFTAPEGQRFKAWSDGTEEYAAGYVYTVTENVTFTAVWENVPVVPEPEVTHTVRFNANGGSGEMAPVTVDHGAEYTLPGCGFTAPEGQQFKEWEIDGVAYQPYNIYTVMADTTVIAVWEDIPAAMWTVTLVPGEGSGTEIVVEVEDGTAYTLPECTFTAPAGQRFKTWKAGGVEYAAGGEIIVNYHTTVVAIWEEIPVGPEPEVTHTVSFDANGGFGEMAPVTVADGAEYTLPECGFTAPEGQRFKAWKVGSVEYAAGDKITVTADTTVTAVWEDIPEPEVEWTVTFSANGGSGTMAPITAADGSAITLPTCRFTAPVGQRFRAWLIDGELYAAGDRYIVTKDVTVFAVWADIPYNPDPQPPVITPTPDDPDPDDPDPDNPDPDDPGDDDPDPVSPVERFRDVDEDDWFYEAVEFCVENGLMNGTDTFRFEPYATATRAQIVTILWRLEGEPASDDSMGFTDVARGEWYTEAVRWAVENGIVNGMGDGTFAPMDTITREQMAAILWRYCRYKGYDVSDSTDISGYADADSVSDWALAALRWACGSGLIQGITESTLVPQGTATRAQIAMILFRFVNGG